MRRRLLRRPPIPVEGNDFQVLSFLPQRRRAAGVLKQKRKKNLFFSAPLRLRGRQVFGFFPHVSLSRDRIKNLTLLLEKDAIVVPGLSAAPGAVPQDPTDEMFLPAALDAKADFIVSGDRHLLELGEYKGIPILTVQQFSERLEKRQSS